MFGLGLVTVWGAPRGAGLSAKLLTAARPDVGRLLNADVRRYTLLFALSAGVLAVGATLAIAAHSMQLLGARQIAAEKADRLPDSLLIAGQSILDQRDSQFAAHHVRTGERRGRRARGVFSLAIDDLIGVIVAPRHWSDAG